MIVVAMAMVALFPQSAQAQVKTFQDPSGDGLRGDALEITSIKLANRDHAVVVTVSVAKLTGGDIGIAFKRPGDRRRDIIGVYAERRAGTVQGQVRDVAGRVPCKRLVVTWDKDSDRIRVRVPAKCLHGGDFGALRAKIITEVGSDADYAPKTQKGKWRWSQLVSRG